MTLAWSSEPLKPNTNHEDKIQLHFLLLGIEIMRLFSILLIIVAVVSLSLWIGLLLYIIDPPNNLLNTQINEYLNLKDLSIKQKFEVLGTTGDFFNIATSFSSVLTVILVSYGVYLQKIEVSDLKNELEKGEKINRTIKLIDQWNSIDNSTNPSKEVELFITNISLLYNKGYLNKIDFNLIGEIISEDPIIKDKISQLKNFEEELDSTSKELKNNELDLKHFRDKNYEEDPECRGTFKLPNLLTRLHLFEEEQAIKQKIITSQANITRINKKIESLKTIRKIIEHK